MHDLLIRNARVIDGTGGASHYSDVLIDGDQISAVVPSGEVTATGAHEVIDAVIFRRNQATFAE
jgi:N-acyl-D-amino-acid deacylase